MKKTLKHFGIIAITTMIVLVITGCPPEITGFTVAFNSQGGSLVAPITGLNYGETISKPSDPTRNGFIFDGWYKEATYTNEWIFETDIVIDNTTLYAKWITATPSGIPGVYAITNPDGTYSISNSQGATGDIHIPALINGIQVTAIDNYAFEGSGITSVIIPASVTSIGEAAFARCLLGGHVIFESGSMLQTIGDRAFLGNEDGSSNHLRIITIPASVTAIGEQAFAMNKNYWGAFDISTVIFEGDNTNFEEDSFADGDILLELYKANGAGRYVKDTDTWIISHLSSIPNVYVITNPDGTYSISNSDEISGDFVIAESIDGIQVTAIHSFAFPVRSITSVTIPKSVTAIGAAAFEWMPSLVSVTFADNSSLETIGEWAFAGIGITSIEIPASVTAIGEGAFVVCDNLETATFESGSMLQTIGDFAFRWGRVFSSITIPASVTTIGKQAFEHCDNLTEVIFEGNNANFEEDSFPYGDILLALYAANGAGTYRRVTNTWNFE